jgi:hypothetical protein
VFPDRTWTLGYKKAAAPAVLQMRDEGRHDTGDIVEINDPGFLRIVARFKRSA